MSKLLCGAAVLALGFAGRTFADEAPAPRAETVVSYRADLADQASAQALYARLTLAAERVCAKLATTHLPTKEDRECIEQALAQAVRGVDRPVLTALYESRPTEVRALAGR